MGSRNLSLVICILPIFLTGCVATSAHVKKGDVLLLRLAQEQESALVPQISQHVNESAGPELPKVPDFLGEILAGSGGVVGLGFALYKSIQGRMKERDNAELMLALSNESSKEKCQEMLLKHPKVKI